MAEEKAVREASASLPNPVVFIQEVNAEMKKVTWPSRKELTSYTLVVALAVFVVCTMIWACDAFFARLFELILR